MEMILVTSRNNPREMISEQLFFVSCKCLKKREKYSCLKKKHERKEDKKEIRI